MDSLATQLTAYSTVAVALFAIVQLAMFRADRRERTRAAYQVIWAEWNRLFSVVDRWKNEDLVKLADSGALDPTELGPPDWAHVSSGLSLLGHGAAKLGASAFSFVAGARRNCDILQILVMNAPPAARSAQQTAMLKDLDGKTKKALEEAVVLLEDSMGLVPPWLKREKFDLGDPKSELGRQLIAELRKQPLTRWRRFRRRLADALRTIARHVDAPPKGGNAA